MMLADLDSKTNRVSDVGHILHFVILIAPMINWEQID